MPHNTGYLFPFVLMGLVVSSPAIAAFQGPSDISISVDTPIGEPWGIGIPSDIPIGGPWNTGTPNSIPPGVWDIIQSQTGGIPSEYESIFTGSTGRGTAPQDIWGIVGPQLGLPSEYNNILDSIFTNDGLTDLYGGLDGFGSGTTAPFSGFAPGGLGGSSSKIPQKPNTGFPPITIGQGAPGQNTPVETTGIAIPDIGEIENQVGGIGGRIAGGIRERIGNINPFQRAFDWVTNNPAARVISGLGNKLRGVLGSPNLGFFTQNSIVKERDQANLFDQEIARMMADSRLGEAGEQWMAGEAQETMAVLSTGIEGANAAMQLSQEAQALTSTQDVAKAVAQVGGQNAAISASVLQMQAQTQSSLLQLQQLTSSAIQLSANNSEAMDEANRRERLKRSNALEKSASEFIYIPNVFKDLSAEK